MKPYQIIKNQNKVIEDLKYELRFSKDKFKSANRINSLIKTSNCLNDVLVGKFKTNALDVLLCYVIKDYLQRYSVEGSFKDGLPLNDITNRLDFNLGFSSNLAIKSLSLQIQGNIIQGYMEESREIAVKKIPEMPNVDDITVLVKELLKEFKQQIVWKK